MMVPIALNGPAVEPVSVPAMRGYLRLDHEDALIAGLIKAGRLLVEAASRRILVETRWRLVLDRWPAGRVLRLPLSPLIALERVELRDGSGAWNDLCRSSAPVSESIPKDTSRFRRGGL